MDESLKGRNLLTLEDYEPAEIARIIDLAAELKKELKEKGFHERQPLANKHILIYFEKKSLRTRVSFEIGCRQLGGHSIFLLADQTHAGRGEPLKDMGRVIERYSHGVVYRAYRHADIVELAAFYDPPVINALCERAHPCQALADLMTMYEHRGRESKIRLAYVGDFNNVSSSLMILCSKVGIDMTLACPADYQPGDEYMNKVRGFAKDSKIEVTADPEAAVSGADFVYTDVWISMGMEEEEQKRRKAFEGFCVNSRLMEAAGAEALFMHDLPAHRGEEVSDRVMDGPNSIVFDQAENRLHAHKAVMALLIGD